MENRRFLATLDYADERVRRYLLKKSFDGAGSNGDKQQGEGAVN